MMKTDKSKARVDVASSDFGKKRRHHEFKSSTNKFGSDIERTGYKREKKIKQDSSEPLRKIDRALKALNRLPSLAENHYEIYDDDSNHFVGNSEAKFENKKLFDLITLSDDEEKEVTPLLDYTTKTKKSEPQKPELRYPNTTKEQDNMIKKIYRDRKKFINTQPFLNLKDPGLEASVSVDDDTRYPLFFPDIQEVFDHIQNNCNETRWMCVKKASKLENAVFLAIEGVGFDDYLLADESCCPSLKSHTVSVEFISPLSYGDSLIRGIASTLDIKPIKSPKEGFKRVQTRSQEDGFLVGLDTLFNIKWKEENMKNSPGILSHKRGKADSVGIDGDVDWGNSKQALPVSFYKDDHFSRLDLVMSPRDMANEHYPLPFLGKFHHFSKTKDEYEEVTNKSPMFGLDCEMCMTQAGSELTRISVVNEKHEVVYDKLVKPYNRITNYLTKYSGITHAMLRDVTTRLPDVHQELRALLPPDAILVGQSLNCDLIALKMMHPYVIDTSLIFNTTGERKRKTKLATLVAEFLSIRIQDPSHAGHNSVEDSASALKLVQAKLKHSLEWGDAVLGYERSEEENRQAQLLLEARDENPPEPRRYRLAINALVDNPSLFAPATHLATTTSTLWNDDSSKGEENPFEKNTSSGTDDEPPTKMFKTEVDSSQNRVMKTCGKDEENPVKKSVGNYNFVSIIGPQEVLDSYTSCLSETARQRVTLVNAEKNSQVIKSVLELDRSEEKRLIIAHLKSSKPSLINKVEKWSSKLMEKCKEKDLINLMLFGSVATSVSSGMFLSSIPSERNIPNVQQVIQDYLASSSSTADS